MVAAAAAAFARIAAAAAAPAETETAAAGGDDVLAAAARGFIAGPGPCAVRAGPGPVPLPETSLPVWGMVTSTSSGMGCATPLVVEIECSEKKV